LVAAEEMFKLRMERDIRLGIISENRKRIDDIESVLNAKPPSHPSTTGLQRLAEGLKWTSNSWGEYAFTMTKGNNHVNPELRPLVDAINAATSRKLVLGGFEYSLNSNPKFLNRRRA
jgi:hypothetical protein